MPDAENYQHYQVLRREDGSLWELGRGAMGITYKAFDTNLRCTVALKVINNTYLDSEVARQRFLREARAAAALRHQNVASVFHLGSDHDSYFYAMEYIDGETVDAPRCGVGGPDLDADEIRPRRVEQDVAWVGSVRQLDRGPAQRNESSALREPESGVVAARSGEFVTFVGHVNQATVNPDADRFETARPDGISNRGQGTIASNAKHRDLVAAGVDRQQVASITAQLQ